MAYRYGVRTGVERIKTKTVLVLSSFILGIGGLTVAAPIAANAVGCTSTGFFRDGINMTAAVVNPTATVSGDVDATGCNVGVYFGPGHNGSVNNATVHGANYYGIVNQRAKVDVTNSIVHDIGETPLNGTQHGVGVYYATITGLTNGDCTTGTTRGKIQGNSVWNYQKSGIVANCTGTNVTISGNTVQGQGPVNYIAQNGIQVGLGADATVKDNVVSGNSYTGANGASSGGILIYGGPVYGGDYTTNIEVMDNILVGNDVGVYASNLQSCGTTCTPASSRTNINIHGNTVANAALVNTTGNSSGQGYQAGVSDQGDNDTIAHNRIIGAGYDPDNSSASIAVFSVDTTATNHAHVHSNKTK